MPATILTPDADGVVVVVADVDVDPATNLLLFPPATTPLPNTLLIFRAIGIGTNEADEDVEEAAVVYSLFEFNIVKDPALFSLRTIAWWNNRCM